MGFGDALKHVTAGKKIRRAGWREGVTVVLRGKGTALPHLWRSDNAETGWMPTLSDLFATDWDSFV